jgi:RES domain-containing protein
MHRSDENHRLSFVPIVAQLGIQAALRSSTMMRSIHDPKTVLDGIVKSIFAGAAERLRLRGDASAVLAVPSAVVPAEFNYLINPAHPDYALLEIGTRTEWLTDQRLMRRATGPR